ncbi:Hydroxypyruvate reductase [Achromobacter deleyi]|uniref:Hydroxypyruvate reductase n=1 Tax=Achromobacter deleyi TaxID=1353891 RepID=A0A6S7AXK6_9BURK|nr:NAD(P)-dependent oxidoreductase [Achromobacter deleyi]CAB3741383.1 Hydroxypyruvate reductase [Achromobacter deleyi]CAB3817777.1 Hydroxypyruvate reductase [Achromobacter deleyi]CAB3869913.1 Hydroxypyruvate reductase [Achromobacter deleyi]
MTSAASSTDAMAASARPIILVTGADLADEAVKTLDGYALVYAGARPTEQDLLALVRQHDPVALIVRYGRISAAVIDAARSLRVISKHGSGIDTIDSAAAAARGIAVKAAAGANAAAVAEHAIALLLACAKSIVPLDARMHAGHWDKATHKSIELAGRTLGLVGLGAIGRRVATVAHALDMRVIGHDPYAGNLPPWIEPVDLPQLWAEADAISLHCPLTDANRGLISAATLAQCRDGLLLVNTARGGLVNEEDLLAAVRSGKVACAGLDSFQQEPPPVPHPFHGQPGLLLSPHVGGVTRDAYVKMGVGAARNVLQVLQAA